MGESLVPDRWEEVFKKPGGSRQALFDHERKIVFIYTPKCGCTTAKSIFYDHVGVELPEKKFDIHTPSFYEKVKHFHEIKRGIDFDEYLKIQFYRDPFQRAACCFAWNQEYKEHPVFYKPTNGQKLIQKDGYMAIECRFKCDSIHQFLEGLIKGSVAACHQCRVHTIKQFVETKIDEKVNIVNLDQELERLNKKYDLNFKNRSVEGHSLRKRGWKYDDYLDEKAIELIKKAYPEDVRFFS